jgi:fluoroacetyl-CoA thioesterase
MALVTGMKRKQYEIVTEDKTASALGSNAFPVYATSALVLLMENTCRKCVEKHLEEGQTIVGTKVNVNHVSPSLQGTTMYCECELVSIDGARLTFKVGCYDEMKKAGEGTLECVVVNREDFLRKIAEKTRNSCV